MSCFVTTRAFYCTNITHDNGSTEDRESGIITPCVQQIDGSHTSASDQLTDYVDAKSICLVIDAWGTHTRYKQS